MRGVLGAELFKQELGSFEGKTMNKILGVFRFLWCLCFLLFASYLASLHDLSGDMVRAFGQLSVEFAIWYGIDTLLRCKAV